MGNRILFACYLATIAAANWAIARFGIVDVSLGFGLMAPAGVYFAGLAFTLRDGLQETGGRRWALGAIIVGAFLSAAVADPAIAVASGTAFALSELTDFAVYTPLRRKHRWLLAVGLSNTVGAVVDSAVFLWLAFGSLVFLPGQVVGKAWTTLAAVVALALWRGKRGDLPDHEIESART